MEIQRAEVGRSLLTSYDVDAISAELQALLSESGQGREHQFFFDVIQRQGGLALELGSGTGKRLLPYLLAGIHVHGVEASPELFAICQARAQKFGLLPTVHRQVLDRLDIPMSFKTIYAPTHIFQQIDCFETAEIVLQKFFEHLEMNGLLMITLEAPNLQKLMQSQGVWEFVVSAERSHDRARIVLSQAAKHSFVEQKFTILQRYDVLHAGGKVETHLKEYAQRWYYKHEFKMMLERAGFAEISVLGDYSMDAATDGHTEWVFLATKKR